MGDQERFAAAFTEWFRRFFQHPDEFGSWDDLTPEEAGAESAAYFLELLKEN